MLHFVVLWPFVVQQVHRNRLGWLQYLQILDAITLVQDGLESVHIRKVGSQTSQALLATATHAHQQSMATLTHQDPADSTAEWFNRKVMYLAIEDK